MAILSVSDMRFVRTPLPEDRVVDDPEQVRYWFDRLDSMLCAVENVIYRGEATARQRIEYKAFAFDLRDQVWTPDRTVLVARPVR